MDLRTRVEPLCKCCEETLRDLEDASSRSHSRSRSRSDLLCFALLVLCTCLRIYKKSAQTRAVARKHDMLELLLMMAISSILKQLKLRSGILKADIPPQ